MRWVAVMCAGVVSCAPSGEFEPVAQVRQAFPTAEFVGDPGSLLGSSLAACPDTGFVAGAPGIGSAWLSGSPEMPTAVGDQLGRTVACQRSNGVALMLAGGSAGARKNNSGVWGSALTLEPTMSIARSNVRSLPILVASVGTVRFFDPVMHREIGTPLVNLSVSGPLVLWVRETPLFLVSWGGGLVQSYTFIPQLNEARFDKTFRNAAPGFGRALAAGELLPSQDEEVAIGADQQVFIYSAGGVELLRLSGSEASFGAALAIQHNYGVGLDALLVSEPTLDQVHRFIGDAGTVVASISMTGSMFGASLAVDPVNTLAIGAPLFQPGGAVFLEPLGRDVREGELKDCASGAVCRTSVCFTGVCVGGAFCDTSAGTGASACDQSQNCMSGVCMDADAGVVNDAGVVSDAGLSPGVDAGVGMGPSIFSTSGCSASGVLPALLLALMMLRRRQ